MKKRFERLDRMKAVEQEFETAKAAIERVERLLKDDPRQANVLGKDLSDLRVVGLNLEATFFIRLFAEFESGLRDYWNNGMKRTSKPVAERLVLSVAGNRTIAQDHVDAVQRVRKYRNGLVHESSDHEKIPISSARKHLCTFFSWLPVTW